MHDNIGDGVDLDSMSQHVMIRRNLLEHNNRCGVFIEEGARSNILIDNTIANNSFGIGFFTNLGGKDPGEYPTSGSWPLGRGPLVLSSSAMVLSSSHDANTSPYELHGAEEMAALPVLDLPDEPRVRDVMRELEHEHPPLKYKIVCHNECFGLHTCALLSLQLPKLQALFRPFLPAQESKIT